jgi:zinc protease
MTSPRLDPARLASSSAALRGYLAGLSNSPDRQFEDFTMAVLSQNHPRALRVPKPSDLDQISAERSVAIYKERFGNATGMTFVLVGSFAVDELKPLLARYLGGLPSAPLQPHFRDVGIRYPTGDIDKTLEKGSDNSALTIIFSGERPYSPPETLKLSALTEVLRLRVIDRIREELGTSYSPGVMSQFTNIPVGQYALRFSIGCAPEQIDTVESTVDEIISALQAKGPTPAELEKVTRTWLNEYDARVRTNEYWSERLRNRALDPKLDDEGSDYVARVRALTVADVQAAAATYADGRNRVRLILASEPSAFNR